MYADDTQIWTEVNLDDPTDIQTKIGLIQDTFTEIQNWMVLNKLKLNADKTEFLLLVSKSRQKQVPNIKLNLCGTIVNPCTHARNLGITLDTNLTLKKHISNIVQSCCVHLRNIRSIRHYLSRELSERLIHAFVTSRLDFCNSVLIGLPKTYTNRLQKVQNWAAKLLFEQSKYTHVTPLLRSLHWLPIEARIQFKIITLVHGCIYGFSPKYLCEIICIKKFKRHTRQSNFVTLLVPQTVGLTYSNRAFCISGPKSWNSLPNYLKCIPDKSLFMAKLKTYLFTKYFC